MTKKTCLFSLPWPFFCLLACCLGLGFSQSAMAQEMGIQSAFEEAQKTMQSLRQEGYTVEWVYIDVIDSVKQVQRAIVLPKEYGLFVLADERLPRIEVAIARQEEAQWKPYYRAKSEEKNFVFATLLPSEAQQYRIEVRLLANKPPDEQVCFALILFHE